MIIQNRNQLVAKRAGIINAPVVKPTSGQGSMISKAADDYFALQVDTSDATDNVEVILFDSNRAIQTELNKFMNPNEVTIEGLTQNYEVLLNDISQYASYISRVRISIEQGVDSEGNCIDKCGNFDSQFFRPIEVYQASRGSKPGLVKTIHPGKGIHEMQYQQGIVTFDVELLIDARTALVYTQEKGRKLTFAFYQSAELGVFQ